MKFTQCLLAALTAAAAAASPTDDGEFFSVLLKRQEPGTPAYNCHDNCGQAIIQAREGGDGVCENAGFVSNYNNCLQCAGPDNVNIWQYYGNSLSAAGEACGFDTEPLDGEQDDVGPATPADSDDGGDDDDAGDDDDSNDSSSSDDSSPTATDDATPSESSPPDAEPTDDDDASDDDDSDSPSESDGGSEEPTSGDDAESSSPSGSTDIPETDAAGALKAGFVGIAVAAACAGGLLM